MKFRRMSDVTCAASASSFAPTSTFPLEDGRITDDHAHPRLAARHQLALERAPRSLVTSHLGADEGQLKPEDSLAPVAARVASCWAVTCRWSATG